MDESMKGLGKLAVLQALSEYEESLKALVEREEAYLEIQREQQKLMEPLQKRFQEATRKMQLALLGREEQK